LWSSLFLLLWMSYHSSLFSFLSCITFSCVATWVELFSVLHQPWRERTKHSHPWENPEEGTEEMRTLNTLTDISFLIT
jgi:hypothetical protein